MVLKKSQGIYLLYALSFLLAASSCKNGSGSKDEVVIDRNDSTALGKAITEVTDKIKDDPGKAELYWKRSQLFYQYGQLDNSEKDITHALNMDSSQSTFLVMRADLDFARNKIKSAVATLEKVRGMDPSNFDAAFRLAEINLYIRNYQGSLAYIDTVLKHDNKNLKAYLMQGIDYKESGDTSKAIESFRASIEVNPDYYEAYMQLGIIMQVRNDKQALDYFSQALRIKPKSEEALYGRGLWYQDHDDYDKAIQDYTSITQINPNNRNAHFNLGYIHQIYLKVYNEAIKHYSRAIDADPAYAEAYYNRALAYETLGNIGPARLDYKKAIELRGANGYKLAEEGLKRVSK